MVIILLDFKFWQINFIVILLHKHQLDGIRGVFWASQYEKS